MPEKQDSSADEENRVTSGTTRSRVGTNEMDSSNSTWSLSLFETDQDKHMTNDSGEEIEKGHPVNTSKNADPSAPMIPDSPRKKSVPYLDFPFMTGKVTLIQFQVHFVVLEVKV